MRRMGWTQTRAGRSQLYGMWWPARHTELNKHPKAARIEITASLNSIDYSPLLWLKICPYRDTFW